MTDVDIVAAATSEGEFDVLEAAKGRSYPSKDVKVYTDAESAHKAELIEREIASEEDPERVNELDAQRSGLRDKVLASEQIWHLRGIDRRVRRAAEKSARKKADADEEDKAEWQTFGYVAGMLIRVTQSSTGKVQEKLWSTQEIADILDTLPDESVRTIINAVNELLFGGLRFDALVTADF